MAVSKLHDSGFGRTGIHGHFRASCVAFASQMEAATSICHPREVIYRDSSLGRATLGASSQEAVAGQRVHTSIRADSRCASSMGTGFLGVSLQEDVGTSWPGTEPQSCDRTIPGYQLASPLCHSGASEAAYAYRDYAGAASASARATESAAIPRVDCHAAATSTAPLATIRGEWGRFWILHTGRLGNSQQEAVVWECLRTSRRRAAAHATSSSHRTLLGDSSRKNNDRILDAVSRPYGNPRRTLQPQHHALPTPHETT